MTDQSEFETYLNVSSNKLRIYLLDKKKLKNLYFKEQSFENDKVFLDLNILKKFLDDNIYEIEKLIGEFIKNIILIVESKTILKLNVGLKKKNYENIVTQKFLENLLIELRDLINENYQDYRIMHMHITRYLFDKKYLSEFKADINCQNLGLETQFIFVPNNFVLEIDKILENFQIKTTSYLHQNYLQSLFKERKIELSEMAFKLQQGYNANEISIIPRNVKKIGFFEKFFQLFS